MQFTRLGFTGFLGFRVLLVTATAALLAACAANEPVDETAGAVAPAPVAEPAPAAVPTDDVATQNLDPYGEASQQSLIDFAGGDRVFFAFDSSELTALARRTLQRQAEWLQNQPDVDIIVEGHCDERGTREYNLALGERRATAVKNYLVALGIGANRVETISYGKERPAVPESNEAAWRLNRRGVTVVQAAAS